ncbi:MAG: hypothetical protein ABI480_10635 [Chitinophagaceae bacterium]
MLRQTLNATICLLLITISLHGRAQTEKFDIATYTPPKDWKKIAKDDVNLHIITDTITGKFCILSVYASITSKGNAVKDFESQWQKLAVDQFKANQKPKTDIQSDPGDWKAVTAVSPIKLEDKDAFIILTVISGHGRSMSVLVTSNDPAYGQDIDATMQSFVMDVNAKEKDLSKTTVIPAGNISSVGNMTYVIPAGWNVTKYSDGDILMPVDIPKGEFLEIWVQQSFSDPGSMEQALKKAYSETVMALNATLKTEVSGGNYVIIPTQKSFRGWDYIRCHGGINMGAGPSPPEYGLDLFLVDINGRIERVAVLKSRKNCNYLAYYSSDKYSYHDVIEDLLFSLRFSDWKEQVHVSGSTNGAGIVGVWQGITLGTTMTSTGAILGAEYKEKKLILFSNGQAYFGNYLPVEGFAGMNTWIMAENSRRDWGSYSFSNGRGMVKLPYMDIALVQQGNRLVITTNKTDHKFVKTGSVDGAHFNGTYVMSSKDFLGNETGKTPTLVFSADGKFSDDGALKILNHENVSCLNPANTPGSGTYEVREHTIIFNYADGRKIRIAFVGTDYDKSNMSPAKLLLGYYDNELLRR